MIHSVSQPIAVAWDSCLFENIIIAHFTELNFFKQAWGHKFQTSLFLKLQLRVFFVFAVVCLYV